MGSVNAVRQDCEAAWAVMGATHTNLFGMLHAILVEGLMAHARDSAGVSCVHVQSQ